MPIDPSQLRRTAKTRSWIIGAFNRLVLSRPYHRFGVNEVAKKAGVGRSTFYEHFKDKDEVLLHAVAPVLAMLAEAAAEQADLCKVAAVLDHVAQLPAKAHAMLTGPHRPELTHQLTDLIINRLQDEHTTRPIDHRIAQPIAHTQMALVIAWLESPPPQPSSHQQAAAIHHASRAILSQLTQPVGALPARN